MFEEIRLKFITYLNSKNVCGKNMFNIIKNNEKSLLSCVLGFQSLLRLF